MEQQNIEQLWYTWSDIGLEGSHTGFRIRAASPGLRNLRGARALSLSWYLRYNLPPGVPETLPPAEAPVSLSFLHTNYGPMLTHKVYVGQEGWGRTGNYFVHLLLLPASLTARTASELWGSSLWQCSDVPLSRQAPDALKPLSLDDLDVAARGQKPAFDFFTVEDALRRSICAFLAPNREQQRLTIDGHSAQIAAVIWGLTHSIPTSLLPDLTFTTYEDEVQKCKATIIGTVSADKLASPVTTPPDLQFHTQPLSYRSDLDADIASFAAFAVSCLQNNARASDLTQLISEAEAEQSSASVEAFIKRFKAYQAEKERTRALEELEHQQAVATRHAPASEQTNAVIAPPREERKPTPAFAGHNPGRRSGRMPEPLQELLAVSVRTTRAYPRAVLLVLALLLITNLFTSLVVSHAASGNIQPTATAQSTGTAIHPASSPTTPTAIVPPPDPANSVFIFAGPQENVQSGHQVDLYIVVRNLGQHISWSYHSPQNGYYLACVDPSDTDCTGSRISTLGNQVVPPGGTFIFIITVNAHFAQSGIPDKNAHHIDLQFKYDNQPLGKPQTLSYFVKK